LNTRKEKRMNALKALLFVLVMAVSGTAAARASEPVLSVSEVPLFSASGKSLSTKQVKQAIHKAAESKKWTLVDQADGKILGSLSWRNGHHSISVEIVYSGKNFSIFYKDSQNMKYEVLNGVPSIHPFYNKYVRELNDAIMTELAKS
jgi:hypothetical protein